MGRGWSVNATPRPLYPPGKRSATQCRGGWVGRSGRVRKTSCPPAFDPWTVQSDPEAQAQGIFLLAAAAAVSVFKCRHSNGQLDVTRL